MKERDIVLAGDIGGTKTILSLVSRESGLAKPLFEQSFRSAENDSLESIVHQFLEAVEIKPDVASFGIAGPVIDGQAHTTNLPWTISAEHISRDFGIPEVALLNDLQAIATAVPFLEPDNLCTLRVGQGNPSGPIGVIAPGTGLGQAFLIRNGDHYMTCASEGGHASFAPDTHEQMELLAFLEPRFGHVSLERVCSGSGIPNIFDYLSDSGRNDEPTWLRNELAQANDPTPVIVNAALERKSNICIATLDLFVRILGGAVGNMALRVFATGGIFLGGGIPPRLLQRLKKIDFLDAISRKGRFSDWVTRIPVHVITDPKAALFGAARHGLDALESR